MPMKDCPVCGVPVKVENLERHVKNQHPRADLDMEGLLTTEERQTVREAKTASRPTLTRSGKRLIAIVAAVVAVILVAAVVLTLWKPPGTEVGQVAPDFTLSTLSGGSVTLSQYRGTPVLLEFMNTQCHYCQQEASVLVSLYSSYSGRVQFLSVDILVPNLYPLNSVSEVINFKTTYGTSWDYAMDTNDAVRARYGVTRTPVMFVLDARGVVTASFPGYTSYSALSDALNQSLG